MSGTVDLTPAVGGFTLWHMPDALDPMPDRLTLHITPTEADALADAIHEWAALARAQQYTNAGPGPLLILMGDNR